MAIKSVPPSVKETAFDCPHCGAYTTQYWYDVFVKKLSDDRRIPFLYDVEWFNRVCTDENIPQHIVGSFEKMVGQISLLGDVQPNYSMAVANLHLSQCFNCSELAVWVFNRLLFPDTTRQGPPANADMPPKVKADYEEASRILNTSPRGAAALLRLAIQKLCIHLGELGKDLNGDIGRLVEKGYLLQFNKRWTPFE